MCWEPLEGVKEGNHIFKDDPATPWRKDFNAGAWSPLSVSPLRMERGWGSSAPMSPKPSTECFGFDENLGG